MSSLLKDKKLTSFEEIYNFFIQKERAKSARLYVGYMNACRHLHQRVEEHYKHSVAGKHSSRNTMFSR